MQGYSGMQQQYGAGPMAPQAMYGVPPGAQGHGPPAGVPTAVVPQRGMYQQQPIRLARFPGSELHAPLPGHIGGPPQMYGPLGQVPLSRTGSAGGAGRPPAGPPSGYGTGPPLQGMQPFQPMLLPRQMPVGLPLQPGYMGPPPQGAYQQHLGMPLGLYGPPQAPPALRVGSGATTPSAQAGSGANTPMHPLQRGLSGGGAQMLMLAPGGPPGSGYATPHLAPQLLQGAVPLMQPPPGIVLPDTLSPPAPGSLRGTGSGSRMPSAAQTGHARAGSYGSGLMEPLTMQVQAPLQARTTLARTNSVGSIAGANSLRSSLEFGGVAGGLLGGGVSPPRRTGSSSLPKAPSFNSRAGSAGRRSVGTAAGGGTQPALDEYDNIKVRVCFLRHMPACAGCDWFADGWWLECDGCTLHACALIRRCKARCLPWGVWQHAALQACALKTLLHAAALLTNRRRRTASLPGRCEGAAAQCTGAGTRRCASTVCQPGRPPPGQHGRGSMPAAVLLARPASGPRQALLATRIAKLLCCSIGQGVPGSLRDTVGFDGSSCCSKRHGGVLSWSLAARQVQLVVPAGYSRNGTSAARNFTFHACLSPASRQQVGWVWRQP